MLIEQIEMETVDPGGSEQNALSEMQSKDPHTIEVETVDPPWDELSEEPHDHNEMTMSGRAEYVRMKKTPI